MPQERIYCYRDATDPSTFPRSAFGNLGIGFDYPAFHPSTSLSWRKLQVAVEPSPPGSER
ncbi:hypothetical protein DO97_01215 [Neosynechococcus sphagnicola sy1]|uniref:Uncharacterized protein n=1 Tax=Neosynechococcus sphagnicola sy1 TaxID=1497020 RepID=A0A098TLP8_9CYAN|nr:hypothetical protein DO97_01215 [Neosynechococcus sphagnicola sy1]